MKRVIFFLCCAAALSWSGCSKNNDGINPDQLIGKWLLVSEYDEWVNDRGQIEGEEDPYTFEESFYIEFRADNTGAMWNTNGEPMGNGLLVEEFEYRFDSGSRMLYWGAGGGVSDEDNPLCIEKLNGSELVMTWYRMDEGQRVRDKSIFQRVD